MERRQIGGKQYRFRDYIARSADKSDRNRPPTVFDLTVVVHSDSSRCRPLAHPTTCNRRSLAQLRHFH